MSYLSFALDVKIIEDGVSASRSVIDDVMHVLLTDAETQLDRLVPIASSKTHCRLPMSSGSHRLIAQRSISSFA